MKVLIISDSHGQTDVLHHVKERHLSEVDTIIHCGDSELKKDDSALKHMIVVRGNCDVETSFKNDHIEELDDITFFVTHGHLYSVKSTLMKLKYKAEEMDANVVCFGHSHIAGAEMVDGILFINPGSISLPKMRKEKTYAILNIAKGQANVDFYDENGDLLTNMSTAFQYA